MAAALHSAGAARTPAPQTRLLQGYYAEYKPEFARMTNDSISRLVGHSPALLEIKEEIARIARSDAKVLITGESGTGKELVAQAVHQMSARSAASFVAVNCAGLPETLL